MEVYLKERPGKRGTSLFLKWWMDGKWEYKFLKLRLTGDRDRDKQIRRQAEYDRVEKQRNLDRGITGEFDHRQSLIAILKKQTIQYRYLLNHIIKFSEGQSLPLSKITVGWLNKFQDYLKTKIQVNTAIFYLHLLRKVLFDLEKEGWASNPWHAFKPDRAKETERDFLTIEEIQKMADTPCADPEIKRAFLFACFSGLRIGDIKSLPWGKVIQTPEKCSVKLKQQKTGKFIYFKLSAEAVKQLYLNENDKIVQHPDNLIFKLPTKVWIVRQLKRWARAAGIYKKNVVFHSSRHSFAVNLLAAGVDVYTVSKLLGHKSVKTTEIYLKCLTEKTMDDAVDKMPELSREAK